MSSTKRSKKAPPPPLAPETLFVGRGGASKRFAELLKDVPTDAYWGYTGPPHDAETKERIESALETISTVFDNEPVDSKTRLCFLYDSHLIPQPFAGPLVDLWSMLLKTGYGDETYKQLKWRALNASGYTHVNDKEVRDYIESHCRDLRARLSRSYFRHHDGEPDPKRPFHVDDFHEKVGEAIKATLSIAPLVGFDQQPWWSEALPRLETALQEFVHAEPKFTMVGADYAVAIAKSNVTYHQNKKDEDKLKEALTELAKREEELRVAVVAYETHAAPEMAEKEVKKKTQHLRNCEESFNEWKLQMAEHVRKAQAFADEKLAEASAEIEVAKQKLEEAKAKLERLKPGSAGSSSSSSSSSG